MTGGGHKLHGSVSHKKLHESREDERSEWRIISHDLYAAIISREQPKGGEGVVQIHGVRKQGGGYWFLTLFAARGRPLAFYPMLLYMIYCTGIVCLLQVDRQWVEASAQLKVWSSLSTALSLVGVALFFLQTFRTNNSYRVWADGRMQMGIFNAELDSIVSFIAGGAIQNRRYSKRVLRWSAAMSEIVKLDLRNDEDNLLPVEMLLTASELQELKEVPHHIRWLYCSQKIQELWSLALNDQVMGMPLHRCFPDMLGKIHLAVAHMVRLQNTPMPYAYISHLRSFMVIWLSMLPFVFINGLGYLTIGICFLIAYSLLGMEAISLEIESPFGQDFNDLPVDNLALEMLHTFIWAYGKTEKIPSDGNEDPDPPEWGVKSRPTSAASDFTAVVRAEVKHKLLVIDEDADLKGPVTEMRPRDVPELQSRPSASRNGWGSHSQVYPAPQSPNEGGVERSPSSLVNQASVGRSQSSRANSAATNA